MSTGSKKSIGSQNKKHDMPLFSEKSQGHTSRPFEQTNIKKKIYQFSSDADKITPVAVQSQKKNLFDIDKVFFRFCHSASSASSLLDVCPRRRDR